MMAIVDHINISDATTFRRSIVISGQSNLPGIASVHWDYSGNRPFSHDWRRIRNRATAVIVSKHSYAVTVIFAFNPLITAAHFHHHHREAYYVTLHRRIWHVTVLLVHFCRISAISVRHFIWFFSMQILILKVNV